VFKQNEDEAESETRPTHGITHTPDKEPPIAATLPMKHFEVCVSAPSRAFGMCVGVIVVRSCVWVSVYKKCEHNYKRQAPVVEPEENPNGVINVPADCSGLEEALKRATPGQTILVAEGEHTWQGKIELDKAVHIRGIRDKVTGFPASKLRGRWRVRIPPPTPWDRNPQEVCTFTNVWCESDSGYCMEITLGHVQMHNSRVYCNAGTSLSVSNTEVGLHGCVLGFPKPSANYGLVVGHKGVVWMHQSVLRCCKNGAFLRETGVLKMHMCEVHRTAHAFGCIVPNESTLEVTNSRLAEIESNWHRASRPASLFQQANYNEKGKTARVQFSPSVPGPHAAETLTVNGCALNRRDHPHSRRRRRQAHVQVRRTR
jgi:hypothetical protein